MRDFSKILGDAAREARNGLGWTQSRVAEESNIDVRTVVNIENYRTNPKLEVLWPFIRTLRIDANEIFYPELQCENPVIIRLRCLLENCSEQEATALIPVIEAVLEALRSEQYIQIK